MTQEKVGFVGLGLMGHGMAKNIVEKGYPLTVVAHRKRAAVDDLVSRGAVEAASLEDLARNCTVIFMCLTGSPEVAAAVAALKPGLAAGAAVVDCSTSDPTVTLRLAAELAAKGHLRDLGEETAQWVRDNYAAGDSWAELGTYAGADGADKFFAFPYKADVKSLVWYVPENFEDAGYEIPETYEDLKALTEQIAADGETPWCIGLGSGGATGWPARG